MGAWVTVMGVLQRAARGVRPGLHPIRRSSRAGPWSPDPRGRSGRTGTRSRPRGRRALADGRARHAGRTQEASMPAPPCPPVAADRSGGSSRRRRARPACTTRSRGASPSATTASTCTPTAAGSCGPRSPRAPAAPVLRAPRSRRRGRARGPRAGRRRRAAPGAGSRTCSPGCSLVPGRPPVRTRLPARRPSRASHGAGRLPLRAAARTGLVDRLRRSAEAEGAMLRHVREDELVSSRCCCPARTPPRSRTPPTGTSWPPGSATPARATACRRGRWRARPGAAPPCACATSPSPGRSGRAGTRRPPSARTWSC
jgi:hypothetical protein